MTSALAYRCDGDLATITIDDGKVNVMTQELLEEFCRLVDLAQQQEKILLIRSGRERVFSAGFDVKTLASGDREASRALLQAGVDAILRLLEYPFPVIGLCAGHAYPMGAFLLLASDVRVGAAGDYLIGMNEVTIGIPVPDFALQLASYRLAPNYLHQTVALGQMHSPDQAAAAGFLDFVVPRESIDGLVTNIIAQLSQIDMAAHASTKKRMRAAVVAAIRTAARERLLPSG